MSLTHPVLAGTSRFPSRIKSFELVIDFDVQVTLVFGIGLVREEACDILALFDSKYFTNIEDSLFPMCVLRVRTSGKPNWFVAGTEINVEPRNQGVNEIVSIAPQIEWLGECQISGRDSVKVDCEDWAGIGDQSFQFHCVDQRLCQGDLFHGRVIEAVNVIPDLTSC